MVWLYYVILLLVMLAGVLLTLMTLPGLWLMLAATAGYAWLTHFKYISLTMLGILLGITVVAEILETFAAGHMARKSGGSRRASIGALVGGVAGAALLAVPLPVIGILVGACLGAFAGAMLMEVTKRGDAAKSLDVGIAAAKGKLAGTLLKVALAGLVLLLTAWRALPI
ncbi:MAG: DUF456 domain-containing protein [Tepidisphaeraceae bacterium]|jgi:hypothetical protein